MSNWLDAYVSALDVRDTREKANEATMNAYTKLADHTAALTKAQQADSRSISEADSETPTQRPESNARASPIPPPIVSSKNRSSPVPAALNQPESAQAARMRTELSTAQAARTTLSSQNADLTSRLKDVESNAQRQQEQYEKLKAQYGSQVLRRKDRDSELVEKRKMLERVQDEMVGLEMQLNMAEQEKARLKMENEDLVKRLVMENETIVAARMEKEGG